MIHTKSLDLFAGIPVADYAAALKWYERLLGSPPTFLPNDIEAVWELAEHRYVYIVQQPEHAGHAMHTLFVDDLDVGFLFCLQDGISQRWFQKWLHGCLHPLALDVVVLLVVGFLICW